MNTRVDDDILAREHQQAIDPKNTMETELEYLNALLYVCKHHLWVEVQYPFMSYRSFDETYKLLTSIKNKVRFCDRLIGYMKNGIVEINLRDEGQAFTNELEWEGSNENTLG